MRERERERERVRERKREREKLVKQKDSPKKITNEGTKIS